MAVTHNVALNIETYGYGYINGYTKNEQPFGINNIIAENNKVTNDYLWKSNEVTEKDIFGRDLDLTALINKPDGYLKGMLSDTNDVDYYRFNIWEYRALSIASDKYNLDITITLDNIPEGCDYELVLYDADGNQVGIGTDNGEGGISITIPNWNMDNKSYAVKVQATEQEKGLVNIYATAQEIDAAKAGAELNTTLKEEIFSQLEEVGIELSTSDFEFSIGLDGKVVVTGIEDQATKQTVENILNRFADKLSEIYFTTNAEIQRMSKQEQYILKSAQDVGKFLQKATGGKVTLADITVENGRIKGLSENLDMLLNNPGQNQTYAEFREEILAIKNYEQIFGGRLLEQFSAGYVISGKNIVFK